MFLRTAVLYRTEEGDRAGPWRCGGDATTYNMTSSVNYHNYLDLCSDNFMQLFVCFLVIISYHTHMGCDLRVFYYMTTTILRVTSADICLGSNALHCDARYIWLLPAMLLIIDRAVCPTPLLIIKNWLLLHQTLSAGWEYRNQLSTSLTCCLLCCTITPCPTVPVGLLQPSQKRL